VIGDDGAPSIEDFVTLFGSVARDQRADEHAADVGRVAR
jgi:hypothetical protein